MMRMVFANELYGPFSVRLFHEDTNIDNADESTLGFTIQRTPNIVIPPVCFLSTLLHMDH